MSVRDPAPSRVDLVRRSVHVVRLREDPAAAAEIRAVTGGYEISPTVRIGATYLPNPTVDAVRQALCG